MKQRTESGWRDRSKSREGEWVDVLGVPVDAVSMETAVSRVMGWLGEEGKMRVVLTPNTEQVVLAHEKQEVRRKKKELPLSECFGQSDLNVCDSAGLVWAEKVLARRAGRRVKLVEKVAGVDLMEKLALAALEGRKNVFLLGGRGDVAERAAEVLVRKLVMQDGGSDNRSGGERVEREKAAPSHGKGTAFWNNMTDRQADVAGRVGWDPGATDISKETEAEAGAVIKKINDLGTDILFVAYGAPWQERWVIGHRKELEKAGVRVAMVVGGAFDMVAGKVARAPLGWRKVGLEWLWRLVKEPWRIKRQLRLVRFVFMLALK